MVPAMADISARASADVEIDRIKLREMRQDQGLTQVALAALCDMNPSYLSQLESGQRPRVSPPLFVRLCDALQIPAGQRKTLRKKLPEVA
jgi:transcriptional regulator with XRE-family HTH domain